MTTLSTRSPRHRRNVGQPGDAPQDCRLAATRRAKQHRDPGRGNREHSLKREFPQRAAKLGVDLVRRRHAPALARRFGMGIIDKITTQPCVLRPGARPCG
jgi:hypothetical protein